VKSVALIASTLLLSACHVPTEKEREGNAARADPTAAPTATDRTSLGFPDIVTRQPFRDPPILRAQVLLDRAGFPAGVIDGREGASYTLALRGFQAANDLPVTGTLDEPTLGALNRWRDVPATRTVSIPAAFAAGPFVPDFPKDAAEQAKLPFVGYRTVIEALAERFHTTVETLAALNPRQTRTKGVLRVPNIADVDPATLGKDERGWNRTLQLLGVAPEQPQAERVVVDKSEGALKAYDAEGRLLAQFPATMGSRHDPLPLGTWKIQGVSRNPDFHYNPKLFWDVSDKKPPVLLKPGPNGPVGVVWLDLSKPHYGIHGTGEPQTIGRAESHGCVRLTNWDAARLAQMVKVGTRAVFQE
jgi:lipoprotein-anchoring transpeptidase ErfK/SrfK